MLPQQRLVDAGLDVKALQEALGDQIAEVAVAHLVLAQEHQMVGRAVQLVDPVGHLPRGHIDLAPDNRLHALGLAGAVEIHRAVHHPVVRDGHGGLPQLLDVLRQPLNPARAVQQAEFGMDMQVDKGHRDLLSK